MENVHELNAKILSLTMLIQEKYPEMSKYIEEMPVSVPNEINPHVDLLALNEYYDSLHDLLKKRLLEVNK